jgi:hypothetical protein
MIQLTTDAPSEHLDCFVKTELGGLPTDWKVVHVGDVVQRTRQIDPKTKPDWRFKYVDVSSVSSERLGTRISRRILGIWQAHMI